MFMASVTFGHAFRTEEDRLDLDNKECPPPGYDYFVGMVRICGDITEAWAFLEKTLEDSLQEYLKYCPKRTYLKACAYPCVTIERRSTQ